MVIATSDGKTVMTTRGAMVPLPTGTTLDRLPDGFFQRNPSPVPPLLPVKTWQQDGLYFFADLAANFPERFSVNGHWYAGPPHVVDVAAKYTAVEKPLDKIVSCTNLRLAPGMTWMSLAFFGWNAAEALSADDCKRVETLMQRLRKATRQAWQQASPQ